MKIVVRYTTPLTGFTKKRHETIDIPDQSTVKDVIYHLAALHGEKLLRTFFNEAQEFEPMFIVTRNRMIYTAYDDPLAAEDEIALVAQFAGG